MAKIKLTVVYEEYVTNGDDPTGVMFKTYEGEERDVLNRIVKKHSYQFEGQETSSAKDLYENLMGVNGDGCDLIHKIIVGDIVEYDPK